MSYIITIILIIHLIFNLDLNSLQSTIPFD